MSKKCTVYWSLWVSLLSSIANLVICSLPTNAALAHGNGMPWIVFVSMAAFFAGGFGTKDFVGVTCSMIAGIVWGQVDFLLMLIPGFSLGCGFIAILVGTAITMILHINYLGKTPIGIVPFIFAAVCMSFANGANFAFQGSEATMGVFGLFINFMVASVTCWLCAFGQEKLMAKYPLEG